MKLLHLEDPELLVESLLENADDTDDPLSGMGDDKDVMFDTGSKALQGFLVYEDEQIRALYTRQSEALKVRSGDYIPDSIVFGFRVWLKRPERDVAQWVYQAYSDSVGISVFDASERSTSWHAGYAKLPGFEKIRPYIAEVLTKLHSEMKPDVAAIELTAVLTEQEMVDFVESGKMDPDSELFTQNQAIFLTSLAAAGHLDAVRNMVPNKEVIATEGYLFIVSDFDKVTFVFGKEESTADTYYSGEAYDWFTYDGPVSISGDVTHWFTPKVVEKIREALEGRVIVLTDEDGSTEELELTPEVLKATSDRQIVQWLDDESDESDGLEDIREALRHVTRATIERASESDFHESLDECLKDALGPYAWVEVNGKTLIQFTIPWKKMRDMADEAVSRSNYGDSFETFEDLIRQGHEKQSLPDTSGGYVTKDLFAEVFFETFEL